MGSAAAPCTVKFQSGYVHANGSATTHGVIDLGMTGLILKLSETRVLKIPKVLGQLQPDGTVSKLPHYTNDDNLTIFENERTIYDRLGLHGGIIHCFRASGFQSPCFPPLVDSDLQQDSSELSEGTIGSLLDFDQDSHELPGSASHAIVVSCIQSIGEECEEIGTGMIIVV